MRKTRTSLGVHSSTLFSNFKKLFTRSRAGCWEFPSQKSSENSPENVIFTVTKRQRLPNMFTKSMKPLSMKVSFTSQTRGLLSDFRCFFGQRKNRNTVERFFHFRPLKKQTIAIMSSACLFSRKIVWIAERKEHVFTLCKRHHLFITS